jgi:hypothetical protein
VSEYRRRPIGPPGYERRRPFEDEDDASYAAGARLGAFLLALVLVGLVAAFSCYQASEPGPAHDALRAALSSTTEVDLLLAGQLEDLRRLARTSDDDAMFRVPGYPLQVLLTKDEVLNFDRAELREIVLSRSADLVYGQGLAAFDRTGEQEARLIVTTQGALHREIALFTDSWNGRFGFVSLVLLVAATVLAGLVVLAGDGYGKFRLLGAATFFAGVIGFGGALFVRFLLGRIGGSDPYLVDQMTLARALGAVLLWNYALVALLGAAIWAVGPVLAFVQQRQAPRTESATTFDETAY